MLVLTRKKDEAIRIGIETPENVAILRKEPIWAINEENLKTTPNAPIEPLATLRKELYKS